MSLTLDDFFMLDDRQTHIVRDFSYILTLQTIKTTPNNNHIKYENNHKFDSNTLP